MPNVEIPFTDEQFRAVAAEALARGMSDTVRDKLVRDAIEAAMRPGSYGSRSLVQSAFEVAINEVVQKAVRDMIASDERILEKVRESARGAIDKILTSKEWTVSSMVATAITNALQEANK